LSVIDAKISTDDVSEEDIVIVGAGIAGLATAVSLQRLYHHPNCRITHKDVLN
jgi:cation diffusion facilitator CzcD-associated flavoprotein CzcO